MANKWNLNEELPDVHPYKNSKPLGGLVVISGTPESAGNYEVAVVQINGEMFPILLTPEILATPPVHRLKKLPKWAPHPPDYSRKFSIWAVWTVTFPFTGY